MRIGTVADGLNVTEAKLGNQVARLDQVEGKLQVLEQILCLFNPSLEMQTTDNFIDWTSITVVHLENVQWSSRSVPVGIDTEIDIATLVMIVLGYF